MNTILAKDIVYAPKITIVNALAEFCEHCQKLKEHLPELEKKAHELGIAMYNIEAIEDNKEFFEQYQNETLPYTFVFDNGSFVGGDSFDAEKLKELIQVLHAKMEGANINVVA